MEDLTRVLLKESPIALALIASMYLFLRAMTARDKMFTEALSSNERALDALQKAVTRLECMVEKLEKKERA